MKHFFLIKRDYQRFGKEDVCICEDDLKRVIQENRIHNYRKINSFKIGDKVRLVSEYPTGWIKEMDKYLGLTVTVKSYGKSGIFDFEENQEGWLFSMTNIEKVIR